MTLRDRIAPVYLYVALVSLLGLGIVGLAAWMTFDPSEYRTIHYWFFFAAVILGELRPIRLPRKTEVLTVTASGTFTFALLLTHGIAGAAFALIVAGVIDDLLNRKQWWKMTFNAGQYGLSIVAGGSVLYLLTAHPKPGGHFEVWELPAIFLAGIAFFAVNSLVTQIAIALSTGSSITASLRSNLGLVSATDCILLALAPVVIAVADYSLALVPLLVVPMFAVYKSATTALRNIELVGKLRNLYEATNMSYGSSRTQESMYHLLVRSAEMFHAQRATLTLFPLEESDYHLQSAIDQADGHFTFMEPVQLDPTEGVWARAVAEETTIRVDRASASPKLGSYLEAQGITDALVTPLRGAEGVIGVMSVSNRVAGAAEFGDEDVKLLETLATHAGTAIENARLVTQLEESLSHLTEMNRLKEEFVASVSHELRTPLTSIKGYIKTMLRKDVMFSPEQQREFLEVVERQSQRLHRLIEDLLVVSRVQGDVAPRHVSPVEIERVLDHVLNELREPLAGHTVDLSLDAGLPAVMSDEAKVHQILVNLIENAAKYSPPGTHIAVEAQRAGAGVQVSVTDQGAGIPEHLREKIFDRFFQVDQSSTREVGGTGLGLYICRAMAEAIGARVWLENSGPEGSRFALWLPLDLATSASQAEPRTTPTS